jgi:hypothetical protein
MKAIMAWTGGRAPLARQANVFIRRKGHRKIGARLAQDLVGLPKLTVLPLESLQLLGHLGRNAGPLPAVDLGFPDPVMQRLRRAADLGRNRGHRRPARRVLAGVIQNHPNRTGPDLG